MFQDNKNPLGVVQERQGSHLGWSSVGRVGAEEDVIREVRDTGPQCVFLPLHADLESHWRLLRRKISKLNFMLTEAENSTRQEILVAWVSLIAIGDHDQSGSGCILKLEPMGFASEWTVLFERKNGNPEWL